jgi:hypothetical protein
MYLESLVDRNGATGGPAIKRLCAEDFPHPNKKTIVFWRKLAFLVREDANS